MHLDSLLLENFRSYDKQQFEFSPQTNLILGTNGSGKTNILEAIYLLAVGKSFRAQKLSQLIKWDHTFASVRCQPHQLEVQLIFNPANSHPATTKRRFLIQSVPKPRRSFIGQLKTVIFHPDDIRLVTGSPSRRRDYLDSVFLQTTWQYASALSQYNKALKHRNELLDLIRLGKSSIAELFYWDQSLIKNSQIIHHYRQVFITSVNQFFINHQYPEINHLFLHYSPSIITSEKLASNQTSDINRGYTQAGIHRDELVFENKQFPQPDQDLAGWGSRGQQRLAVLGLKLAEIDYLEKSTGDKPILLLDDIFSELDPEHQQLVIDICGNYQSIFTSAEEQVAKLLTQAKIINLS